jgi:NCS1 family nucleobase:cation symporter-1
MIPLAGAGIGVVALVIICLANVTAVYDNYGRFLSWGAIILAPLCAVQIVDYFILRRRQLHVRDLSLPINQ